MTTPTWPALGRPGQNALSWAVAVGGAPYASDLAALRRLARDGLVVEDPRGRWAATDTGRDVYARRDERTWP
jgi:hypothetical protein